MRGSVHAFRAQAMQVGEATLAQVQPRLQAVEQGVQTLTEWAAMAHGVLGGGFWRRMKWLLRGK